MVPRRVTDAVLHDGISGPQSYLSPVVELEPDLARHDVNEVDAGGRMQPGLISFHVLGPARELFVELLPSRPRIQIRNRFRACGRHREDGEPDAERRWEVVGRRLRRAIVGYGAAAVEIQSRCHE